MIEQLSKNYETIREGIAIACQKCARNPHEITIVAISKTFPFSSVIDLNKMGHLDFGENKVKEIRDKYYNISFQYTGTINWHFVGHLQTNKVKDIVAFIHLIHSVDSINLAEEIQRCAGKIKRTIDVLVQVNSSREPQKYGIEPENAEDLCNQIASLENVKVKGLMTMAKLTEDKEEIRSCFRETKELYDKIKAGNPDFQYLSMGMTQDYDIAIEEGSNMLRIGTAIFGNRKII
jgi:hypothetical protein